MQEPVLVNRSGFRVEVLPILDRDGAPARVVVVKASFGIGLDGELHLLPEQRAIRLGDEPWGAPERADVRLPCDFCAAKPGTDVVVVGHAVPPAGQAPICIDVALQVADRAKRLRVHGPRLWRRSLLGVVPAASAPMREPTPLAWSRAWGGIDLSDPAAPLEEPRNPAGSGIARHPERLVNTPAPQIETPGEPVGAAGGTYRPAGCAALGPGYAPRRGDAGTYDAAWLAHGYPGRPVDYRDRHENVAPPDQIFREPLRGGEAVALAGIHPTAMLSFRLPKWRVVIEARLEGARPERRPHLDTVVLDADARVLELVWRTTFRCPAKMHRHFDAVNVLAKEFLA